MMGIYEDLKDVMINELDFEDIVGLDNTKSQLRSAFVSGHHIILVGPPGVGKTTLSLNIAKKLPEIEVYDCPYNCSVDNPKCEICKAGSSKRIKIKGEQRFVRIQGSPDLSAEDLIGDIDPKKALEFGPLSIKAFTPGKIFKANNKVLFFDEINRCPQKLQNALLQALSEKKATIGSYDVDIDSDFIFIGTMNPDDSSTENLSDVFLDRFDVIETGYPETLEQEIKITKKSGISEADFNDELLVGVIGFIRSLRGNKNLEKKPSVRASIALYNRSQSNALISGRKDVSFLDVYNAIVSVLSHRIKLKPSVEFNTKTSDFLRNEFEEYSHKKGLKDTGGEG
jgi:MoxR-like ATPase